MCVCVCVCVCVVMKGKRKKRYIEQTIVLVLVPGQHGSPVV